MSFLAQKEGGDWDQGYLSTELHIAAQLLEFKSPARHLNLIVCMALHTVMVGPDKPAIYPWTVAESTSAENMHNLSGTPPGFTCTQGEP